MTSARSRMISVLKETGHRFARCPLMRSEHSHEVSLPPLRSHPCTVQCRQHQRTLPLLQQAALGRNPNDLVYARVRERCCDVVEHTVAQTVISVTLCSKIDGHPQGLRDRRSSAHVMFHVSCQFGCHEPALVSIVLHVVNESATDSFGLLAVHMPRRIVSWKRSGTSSCVRAQMSLVRGT